MITPEDAAATAVHEGEQAGQEGGEAAGTGTHVGEAAEVVTDTGTPLSVYQSLLAAAGNDFQARMVDEETQPYLRRIVERISEIDQADFDKMPEGAQNWFNGAVEQLNKEEDVTLPAGFADEPGTAKPTGKGKGKNNKSEGAAAGGKSGGKTAGNKSGANKSGGKKEQEPPKEKEPQNVSSRSRPRTETNIGKVIREALVMDQSLTREQLTAKLDAAGFKDVKPATLSTLMADCLKTLRVATELGKFQPNPPVTPAAVVVK